MKKTLRATVITAVLALALTAIGVAPASAKTATTGKVGITVTAPGGLPIPHVKVTVTAKAVTNPGGAAEGDMDYTNVNGRVVTPELAPGTYTVTAQLKQPVATQKTVEMTVTAAENSQLTIALPGVQYITGTVTAYGRAVTSARVHASDGKNAYGVSTVAGEYKLLVKPGVGYRVVARPKSSNSSWLATYAGNTVRTPDAKIITPSKASPATVNIAAYDRTGRLSGRVLTPSGKLAKNAWVSVCASNRWGCVTVRPDSEGVFTARGLPAGTYRLDGNTRTATGQVRGVTVRVGRTSQMDVTVRKPYAGPVDMGKILLTLTVPSAVVREYAACATLIRSDGTPLNIRCLSPGERKMVFPGLLPGTYRVALNGANTAKTVTVKKDTITRTSMTRIAGTVLTGKVTTSTGAPAKNAYVSVFDENGTALRAAETNAQGIYRVPFVTRGAYTVRIAPSSDAYAVTWRNVRVSGSNPTADVTLNRSVTLTGKVVDAVGDPIVGVEVSANSDLGYDRDKTDAKGVYTLRGLDPGTHRVTTLDWYVGGYLDGTSSAVSAPAGKTTTVPTITLRD